MRPPEFTGGNRFDEVLSAAAGADASMRPPEFTGGNRGGRRRTSRRVRRLQ